jgi:hypothetical protein
MLRDGSGTLTPPSSSRSNCRQGGGPVAFRQDAGAGASSHRLRARIGQQRQRVLREVVGAVGHAEVDAPPAGQSFGTGARNQHRPLHRHRFQHLVLDAAGDTQRSHHQTRVLHVRPDVRDAAGDDHARVARQRLDGRRRIHPDDIETHVGPLREDLRQDFRSEPADRVDVRPVVHRSGENDRQFVRGERGGSRGVRAEVRRVDAVLDHVHATGSFRRKTAEHLRLRARGEHRGRRHLRDRPLVRQQPFALAAEDRRRRPALRGGVLRPLGRIDVAEIDHHPQLRDVFDELRHRRREHHALRDGVPGDDAVDPALQCRRAVVRDRQRLAAQQAGERAHLGKRRGDVDRLHAGAHRRQRGHVNPVGRIVDEGAKVQLVARGEVAQQVVRTDLVALVRRKRNAVAQKQQRLHVHPRLRTMPGPSAFATARGRRCQTAISARYFGLVGLFCGMASRLSSAYS